MVGGVVALLMGNQHLRGDMTEEVWPALGASLKYLDLSGVDQMTLCILLFIDLMQTKTPLSTEGCCPVSSHLHHGAAGSVDDVALSPY